MRLQAVMIVEWCGVCVGSFSDILGVVCHVTDNRNNKEISTKRMDRLRAALRANLKRRKAQVRGGGRMVVQDTTPDDGDHEEKACVVIDDSCGTGFIRLSADSTKLLISVYPRYICGLCAG